MPSDPPAGRKAPMRPCVQCGELYEAKQEHKNYARRFCSQACAGAYNSARAAAKYPPREEVERAYRVEGLTDRDFGSRHGHSYQWALTVRRHYGIAASTAEEKKAARPPSRTVHTHGYIKVDGEYEHRKVVEARIGRKLVPGEVVHHVDRNPANNDPDNLVLYPSHSEHLYDERGRYAKRRSKSKRRNWTEARHKVEAEGRCRVCGRSDVRLEAAHIIPRSLVPAGPGEHVDNIVPLCAERCHPAYDQSRSLDLLPFLTLGEQGYAVLVHPDGLLGALRRVTNDRSWRPERKDAA